MNYREMLKDKKRIVVKIGSSSLAYKETGNTDLMKLERLVRVLTSLHNSGKEIILVSSGAIAVGKKKLGYIPYADTGAIGYKQACAAVGQAQLMMIYQKLFAEYNQLAAQILMTKDTMVNGESRINARNTFEHLLQMGIIPIVNENDTVSTYEIGFSDNDRLSAIVTALTQSDLLILLSDIDGLFSDDPNTNPDARFIDLVEEITPELLSMGKESSSSGVGTGGMRAKLAAAQIATDSGADMIIANGDDVTIIDRIMKGANEGTLFLAHKNKDFYLLDYLSE